jgi:hypothetical protein
MIDLVTVVFQDELPVLKLQAASVARYCQNIGIRNIYVVVNDDDNAIQHIDVDWWGELANRVMILPRSVFSTEFVDNGWVSQQVLKLLAASMSHNAWSMVLDAKTIFVRDVELAELIDPQGRAQVGLMPTFSVFEYARLIVNELFDINMTQQLGPGGVPFMLHNNTVRLMLGEISFLTDQSFPVWFQAHGRLTEFMLYSGYVQYKFGSFDKLYSDQLHFRPVNVCHSEVGAWDRKFKEMHQTDTLTVSVHRRAWEQLSTQQRQQYKSLLVDSGISEAQQL